MTDHALRITETVARLQKELRCGICCSTYKDPILSTCFHMFCRSCIDSCFERKRKVQCPICRSVLDKRSCRDSYQVTMAVQNYLKLSEAFKKDIADHSAFKSLPPEKMFVESQVPLDITIIPENDGKRCAPEFAIPLLPVRRRRASKPKPAPEPQPEISAPTDPTSSASNADPSIREIPEPGPIFADAVPSAISLPEKKEMKDEETTTDPQEISATEMSCLDLSQHINTLRKISPEMDEIDALFRLIPSIRPILEKNRDALLLKIGITEHEPGSDEKENIEVQKPEKRVSFAKIHDPEVAQRENDEDEVVEDSEDDECRRESKADVENTTQSTVDGDRTAVGIIDEEMLLDEDLARVPKTIVCSRIHNDLDEVELLSDFYHKFLSNSCRFSDTVNAHTTHLIMMNSEDRTIPQKSTAYLQAIARKCVVVGRKWLVDCLQKGLLLSEEEYTITSCPSVLPSTTEIGWLRARNDAEGKLFAGCRFIILRKFTMNPHFDYKQLIELVQLCGGELLSSYDNLSSEKLYIVFSKDSKAIEESRRMLDVYKCDVVTMEWVLDSISEYTILSTENYQAVKEFEGYFD